MKQKNRSMSTQTLVLGAILTALVVILQFLGAFIRFGPFSISLVLIPIVIGSATCGVGVSTWLGFVFGVVVLLSGDAAAFLVIDVVGTVLTVLIKGTAAGFVAGLTYRFIKIALDKFSARQIGVMKRRYGLGDCCENAAFSYISRNNQYGAVLVSAIVCPILNTGVFLLGCLLFFMGPVAEWASAAGFGEDVGKYMILGLVGGNFLFELLFNVVLSPVIVRIVNAKK